MFKYLQVCFDEDYYCEKIQPYYSIRNESEVFVTVVTYPRDSTITDISIFSEKEWNTLLLISEKFEDESNKASWYSDWEYQQVSKKVKSSIYFLKDKCQFAENGFKHLRTHRGTKPDILDYILDNSINNPITTNKFREWVVKSWDIIEENLRILVEE